MLTKTDINALNKIFGPTTVWLDEKEHSEDELNKMHDQVKLEAHKIVSKLLMLLFRRLRLASKIYNDKCDVKLTKDLKKSFGQDAVMAVGDWSAPNAKFHEATRNKGLLRFLKKAGFSVYHMDEFKTSSCCLFCLEGKLEKFKIV